MFVAATDDAKDRGGRRRSVVEIRHRGGPRHDQDAHRVGAVGHAALQQSDAVEHRRLVPAHDDRVVGRADLVNGFGDRARGVDGELGPGQELHDFTQRLRLAVHREPKKPSGHTNGS
jgi:hypothetical protein